MNNFDERQRKEIEFSILYLNEFEHGTDGHNAKVIIAKMAGLLDRREVVLREALKTIAKLTPFPTGQGEALDTAINKTADYADEVRAKIKDVLE